MTSPRSLTALDEAQAALLAMLAPVAPHAVVLAEALGLVAAECPPLESPVPARSIALREGCAMRAEDIAGASSYAPAMLMQAPVRVRAGDILPGSCDCVVEAEAVDISSPVAQAFVESYPGENIRRAGEDFAVGAIVIPPGRKLGVLDLLAASRAGLAQIPVRQPRVALVGDEGESAQMIARLVRQDGARIVSEPAADLVLAFGAAPEGATWMVQGIALEPGRDAAIGRIGAAPAVLVPPMPDQALAAYWALLRPALDRLSSRAPRSEIAAPLAGKVASRVGVAEIALLVMEQGRFVPLAVGDLPLQSLSRATHFALISAASEGCAAGAPLAASPICW